MTEPRLDADATVGEVTAAFPETVAVFLGRRMHCPGCAMAPFVTIGEAAASYAIDPGELIAELRSAAAGGRP